MPCTAPPRGITDPLVSWSDVTDNNPCAKEDYAAGLCKLHWQMKNGLIQPGGVDAFTVFLIHADGPDGSTTFTDVAGHPITALGGAKVSTAQSRFGGSSLLVNGTSDYLTTPDSPDWSLGAGDFTIDCWVNFNLVSGLETMVAQWPSVAGQTAWILRFDNGGPRLSFYYSPDGTVATPIHNPWTPVTGTWYHVAVVRSGNNLMMFVNGTQIGATQTLSGAIFDSTAVLSVGGNAVGAWLFNGYLDEVRVSKGIARWTSNFSVPTAPYT